MLDTPINRRSALVALAGAGGTLAVASLAACSSGESDADATATEEVVEETAEETPADANVADATADLEWWKKTIVYECYPKSFLDTVGQGTGTLAGVTSKLDYLQQLGVGAIWLTPVFKSPQKDNGYDVADYRDIDPSFGTMDDMDTLIEEAGKRDIRIVMDLVMNHTSEENEWFIESSSSKDNPKADWYVWADAKEDGSEPTNWRSIFGGSAWTWNEDRQQYYLHTFGDFQPDLNWESEELRQELYSVARYWLDKGVGGFRVDAIPYIKKPAFEDGEPDAEDGMSSIHAAIANTPGILDFLHEFKDQAMGGSDAFTVGEANGVPASDLPKWVGPDGVFDMIFEFSHILVPQGGNEIWYEPDDWTLTQLKEAFGASEETTMQTGGWYPIYLENHDQPRSASQFLPGAEDKVAGAKMLGTVLMTLRGTPFLYQGEELGYTNVAWDSIDDYDDVSSHNQYKMALQEGHTEEEALEAVHKHSRDNARTPMQWDDSTNAGFTDGDPWLPVHDDYAEQNADLEENDPESVLSYYRTLAQTRAAEPLLIAGDYKELMNTSEEVFAYERTYADRRAVVLANFVEREVDYDASLVEGLEVLIDTHDEHVPGKLQPFEAVVFTTAS